GAGVRATEVDDDTSARLYLYGGLGTVGVVHGVCAASVHRHRDAEASERPAVAPLLIPADLPASNLQASREGVGSDLRPRDTGAVGAHGVRQSEIHGIEAQSSSGLVNLTLKGEVHLWTSEPTERATRLTRGVDQLAAPRDVVQPVGVTERPQRAGQHGRARVVVGPVVQPDVAVDRRHLAAAGRSEGEVDPGLVACLRGAELLAAIEDKAYRAPRHHGQRRRENLVLRYLGLHTEAAAHGHLSAD